MNQIFKWLIGLIVIASVPAQAAVKIDPIFSDNMVLQRRAPVPVWGTASAGEEITVKVGKKNAKTKADAKGQWRVVFPELYEGGPFSLTVTGKSTVQIKNVMIGDVWLVAGTDNVALPQKKTYNGGWERRKSFYPQVRVFTAAKADTDKKGKDSDKKQQWTVCTPETVGSLSGVCYAFGRNLFRLSAVPVGIIQVPAKTPLAAWLSPASSQKLWPNAKGNSQTFKSLIQPLSPFAVRGFAWYGANETLLAAALYEKALRSLIADWRTLWKQENLPVLLLQHPISDSLTKQLIEAEAIRPQIWEAQRKVLDLGHVRLVPTMDIGANAKSIINHQADVGFRLAQAAHAMAIIERGALAPSGPIYKSMAIKGNTIHLSFTHSGAGLISQGPLSGFTIAGKDRIFVQADARISGKTVIVSSQSVAKPLAVRYGWVENPVNANLYNRSHHRSTEMPYGNYRMKSQGLPACPFRTDNWDAKSVKTAPELRLPEFFSHSMVLQQGIKVPIWGWAKAKQKITITCADQKTSAIADKDGKWFARLGTLKAGGPYELKFQIDTYVRTLKDVYVGEVWLCSGQSNAGWAVSHSANADDEIAAADYPQIRMFNAGFQKGTGPQTDLPGQFNTRWQQCSPDTVNTWSAMGYFFARHLQQKSKVPIGIIHSSVSGTNIERWMRKSALEATGDPRAVKGRGASGLWNGKIAPLVPFGIRGIIWYQGESNSGETYYQKLFTSLIQDWRQSWGQKDLPFLYVQLATYLKPVDKPAAGGRYVDVREAQRKTLSLPNTAMAVSIDIGDAKDQHPKNKQEVGRRLGLAARALVYGESLVYSGPLYESMSIEGKKIRLRFKHVGSGLVAKGGPLKQFAIAGADKKAVHAKAKIDGKTVLVWSDKVAKPKFVYYAYATNPEGCNLYNKEGLPASPFMATE
ncbi:MAG: hypothetical protein HRT89_23135 [Lentisphaeria bacterium]|nr:sialate O-acetylesterase [Lentisphaeria bacterium]NQZ70955.1 hypothetical protein [Lentisphaeria bacterium]